MTIKIRIEDIDTVVVHPPLNEDLVGDKKDRKEMQIFDEVCKLLEKRGLIEDGVIDEYQDGIELCFIYKEEVSLLQDLQNQRNKLNRQISSLKKANLKN